MALERLRHVYLAYFDESGDAGVVNSPTRFFVLAGILVHESNWLPTLDLLIQLRARLRNKYQISTRPELKSTDLRRGRGPLTDLHLSPAERMRLYRGLMSYQARYLSGVRVMAIAIDKAGAAERNREPRGTAWLYALQRLERFCADTSDQVIVFPDEGHGDFIKRMSRRLRRYHTVPQKWGGGTFKRPMKTMIEDPNDRQSHDSYFVQMADWNAYAAHRSQYVDPTPSVSANLWDALGPRLLLEVNKLNGGPPGLVVYP